ncbi:hypothetical protein D3C75_788680 [compost metagenome]
MQHGFFMEAEPDRALGRGVFLQYGIFDLDSVPLDFPERPAWCYESFGNLVRGQLWHYLPCQCADIALLGVARRQIRAQAYADPVGLQPCGAVFDQFFRT